VPPNTALHPTAADLTLARPRVSAIVGCYMSIIARALRLVLLPLWKECDRHVELLRREQINLPPISKTELAQELAGLSRRVPQSKAELSRLEAELFVLGERIRKSQICGEVPHFVWHYISDAEIRYKEPDYASGQEETLRECIRELGAPAGNPTSQ